MYKACSRDKILSLEKLPEFRFVGICVTISAIKISLFFIIQKQYTHGG